MKQTQYSIKEAPIGNFTVEVREADGVVRPTDGFPSMGLAENWIREQKRMAAAADRADATKIGQMHRDD